MKHQPTGLIDIHSHLLPVQDGPKDMGQTIQALKIAEENNITDMILTPHYYSGDKSYDQKLILDTFDNLKTEICKSNLRIRLYLGNECVVDEKLIDDLQAGKAFTLNNTKYVLCEYPFYQVQCNYQSNLYKLLDKGFKPIIAHPERNAFIERNYESILELAENGCLIQCNAGSFFKKYGRSGKKYAVTMLKEKIVNFFATDSHSHKNRSPEVYKKLHMKLKNNVGTEYLFDLFDKNLRLII